MESRFTLNPPHNQKVCHHHPVVSFPPKMSTISLNFLKKVKCQRRSAKVFLDFLCLGIILSLRISLLPRGSPKGKEKELEGSAQHDGI